MSEGSTEVIRVGNKFHSIAKIEAAKRGISIRQFVEDLISGLKGPIEPEVLDPFDKPPVWESIGGAAAAAEEVKQPGQKLPPMDEWGNELIGATPEQKKIQALRKIKKPMPTDLCPHFIKRGGYCKACGGKAK